MGPLTSPSWSASRLACAWMLSLAAACASLHGRNELDEQLFLHHNNLRWGRLGNAALQVKPELRSAFIASWSTRTGAAELQDLEVTAVTVAPDGATADVLVTAVWVERTTMSVRQAVVTEVWQRTPSGWIVERPAELPE